MGLRFLNPLYFQVFPRLPHLGLNYHKLIYNSHPLSGLIFFTLVKEGWIHSTDELKYIRSMPLFQWGESTKSQKGVNRVVLARGVKYCTMLFEVITPATSHRAV